MDYEKAYKEALERARAGKPMNEVFPELHESEDERIMDDIMFAVETWLPYERAKEIRAYLERQKAQKPLSTEETELNSIAFLEQMGYTCIPPGKEQKEQTKDEQEYVRTLKSLISDFLRGKDVVDTVYYEKIYDWLDRWLKSIRTQPQRRDTYYDIIHNILAMLKDIDFTKITPEHRVSLLNDIRVQCKNADECASILDEHHWKPSEEQMEWLKSAVRLSTDKPTIHGTIVSLYESLKRL